MKEFLTPGCGPSVPGWRRLYFRALANQRSPRGVGVSTPFGLVSSPANQFWSWWGWGFHTVRGGVDMGNIGFRPHFVKS